MLKNSWQLKNSIVYLWSIDGSLAQLVEHLPYKQMVIGSSPIIPTSTLSAKQAGVAQW